MGREVRRVPPDWEHPRNDAGAFIPLRSGEQAVEYLRGKAQWARGFVSDFKGGWRAKDELHEEQTYEDYAGDFDLAEYMPAWPLEVCTHWQMYEDTTEGTPISPPMATREELATWLEDNRASAFAGNTATRESWLRMIYRGSAVTAMITPSGELLSGVEAFSKGRTE